MAKKNQSSRKSAKGSKDEDFESALADVEKVVHRLESGELGLTEALAEYERGIEKIKLCHETLQRAELKIQLLTQVDEDGSAHVESIDRTPPQAERAPISDVDGPEGLF
ncbi:MAG: exodeoxyribonuclease VII small subunit [Planctomycetota bacterium]